MEQRGHFCIYSSHSSQVNNQSWFDVSLKWMQFKKLRLRPGDLVLDSIFLSCIHKLNHSGVKLYGRIQFITLWSKFKLASWNTSMEPADWENGKKNAVMMFKSLIGLALAYMQELFSEQGTACELHNSFRKLTSSQPRTNYLKRNSCHNGVPVWTSLPESIRLKIKSIGQVKKIDFAMKLSDSHSRRRECCNLCVYF